MLRNLSKRLISFEGIFPHLRATKLFNSNFISSICLQGLCNLVLRILMPKHPSAAVGLNGAIHSNGSAVRIPIVRNGTVHIVTG